MIEMAFTDQKTILKKPDLLKKGPAVPQFVCKFPGMPEVGVHAKGAVLCSGPERNVPAVECLGKG